MSISHDKGVGPEMRYIAINFYLSRSLDGTSHRDKTTPAWRSQSHLFSGSNCDSADQIGADRQNRLGNKVPKCAIYATRGGTTSDSRLTNQHVRCGSVK